MRRRLVVITCGFGMLLLGYADTSHAVMNACSETAQCSYRCKEAGNTHSFCSKKCVGKHGKCLTRLHCKYNTFSAEHNFLEITNVAYNRVWGAFEIFDHSGERIGEAYLFSVERRARKDFDIHSIVGPRRYGQIVVYVGSDNFYDPPFEFEEVGLAASVSHYKASGFEQTISEQCIARDAYGVYKFQRK